MTSSGSTWLAVIACCSTAAPLPAQNATLSGKVTGSNQAIVTQAEITALDMNTGAERSTRSNSAGQYALPSLPPGRYKLTVEARGYMVRTMEKVVLQPEQNARLDIVLQSAGSDIPEMPRQPDYSSEVKVVSLLATVRDQDGRIVKNLTQDDFVLEDDGVPQKIRYFTHESDLPLKIGLLVDTSGSETYRLNSERAASFTFLDRILRTGKDQAFIARFDGRTAVLSGLTSSREELSSSLNQLRTPPGFGTVIFSAIRDCSKNVMQKEVGRKALILLTDGVDHFDHTSIGAAIESAQGADCMLYSIRIFDAWPLATPLGIGVWQARLAKAKKGLERMALETGGEEFEVSKHSTIDDIYSRIEEALRNQYSIGYVPDPAGQPGKFHKVKLRMKDPHLVVRSRAGYYGK